MTKKCRNIKWITPNEGYFMSTEDREKECKELCYWYHTPQCPWEKYGRLYKCTKFQLRRTPDENFMPFNIDKETT